MISRHCSYRPTYMLKKTSQAAEEMRRNKRGPLLQLLAITLLFHFQMLGYLEILDDTMETLEFAANGGDGVEIDVVTFWSQPNWRPKSNSSDLPTFPLFYERAFIWQMWYDIICEANEWISRIFHHHFQFLISTFVFSKDNLIPPREAKLFIFFRIIAVCKYHDFPQLGLVITRWYI